MGTEQGVRDIRVASACAHARDTHAFPQTTLFVASKSMLVASLARHLLVTEKKRTPPFKSARTSIARYEKCRCWASKPEKRKKTYTETDSMKKTRRSRRRSRKRHIKWQVHQFYSCLVRHLLSWPYLRNARPVAEIQNPEPRNASKKPKNQWIAKGAGGKRPRQKTSKIVKKCQQFFRHFSTIFARHHFSGPLLGALKKSPPRRPTPNSKKNSQKILIKARKYF